MGLERYCTSFASLYNYVVHFASSATRKSCRKSNIVFLTAENNVIGSNIPLLNHKHLANHD